MTTSNTERHIELRNRLQQQFKCTVPDVSSLCWSDQPEKGVVDVYFNRRSGEAVVRVGAFAPGTSVYDDAVLEAIVKSGDWDRARKVIGF